MTAGTIQQLDDTRIGTSELPSRTVVVGAVPPKPEFISVVPQIPDEFLLGTLRDGRLRVTSAFRVKRTVENQDVILEAIEINEFGFGPTLYEALSDLQAAIVDLYLTLEADQARLGPDLQRVWFTLQDKIAHQP